MNSETGSDLWELWHRRLGHPSHQRLLEMSRSIPLSSSQSFLFNKEHLCSTCQLSKSHRLPFPNSDSRCKESFHLVHSDVWGPCPELSFNGMRDFVTFIDDHSRVVWLYFFKKKSDVLSVFKSS